MRWAGLLSLDSPGEGAGFKLRLRGGRNSKSLLQRQLQVLRVVGFHHAAGAAPVHHEVSIGASARDDLARCEQNAARIGGLLYQFEAFEAEFFGRHAAIPVQWMKVT